MVIRRIFAIKSIKDFLSNFLFEFWNFLEHHAYASIRIHQFFLVYFYICFIMMQHNLQALTLHSIIRIYIFVLCYHFLLPSLDMICASKIILGKKFNLEFYLTNLKLKLYYYAAKLLTHIFYNFHYYDEIHFYEVVFYVINNKKYIRLKGEKLRVEFQKVTFKHFLYFM